MTSTTTITTTTTVTTTRYEIPCNSGAGGGASTLYPDPGVNPSESLFHSSIHTNNAAQSRSAHTPGNSDPHALFPSPALPNRKVVNGSPSYNQDIVAADPGEGPLNYESIPLRNGARSAPVPEDAHVLMTTPPVPPRGGSTQLQPISGAGVGGTAGEETDGLPRSGDLARSDEHQPHSNQSGNTSGTTDLTTAHDLEVRQAVEHLNQQRNLARQMNSELRWLELTSHQMEEMLEGGEGAAKDKNKIEYFDIHHFDKAVREVWNQRDAAEEQSPTAQLRRQIKNGELPGVSEGGSFYSAGNDSSSTGSPGAAGSSSMMRQQPIRTILGSPTKFRSVMDAKSPAPGVQSASSAYGALAAKDPDQCYQEAEHIGDIGSRHPLLHRQAQRNQERRSLLKLAMEQRTMERETSMGTYTTSRTPEPIPVATKSSYIVNSTSHVTGPVATSATSQNPLYDGCHSKLLQIPGCAKPKWAVLQPEAGNGEDSTSTTPSTNETPVLAAVPAAKMNRGGAALPANTAEVNYDVFRNYEQSAPLAQAVQEHTSVIQKRRQSSNGGSTTENPRATPPPSDVTSVAVAAIPTSATPKPAVNATPDLATMLREQKALMAQVVENDEKRYKPMMEQFMRHTQASHDKLAALLDRFAEHESSSTSAAATAADDTTQA